MRWCQVLELIPDLLQSNTATKISHLLNSSSHWACSTTEKEKRKANEE